MQQWGNEAPRVSSNDTRTPYVQEWNAFQQSEREKREKRKLSWRKKRGWKKEKHYAAKKPHRDRVNGTHSDIRDARWAADGVENKTERIIGEGLG